jgi:hypothetical protein
MLLPFVFGLNLPIQGSNIEFAVPLTEKICCLFYNPAQKLSKNTQNQSNKPDQPYTVATSQ